jgi:hypothetical protein
MLALCIVSCGSRHAYAGTHSASRLVPVVQHEQHARSGAGVMLACAVALVIAQTCSVMTSGTWSCHLPCMRFVADFDLVCGCSTA